MHIALTQTDVIHEIFTHLSTAPLQGRSTLVSALRPQEYWCEGNLRSTVARCEGVTIQSICALRSLALTCKVFSEPALNELWAAPPGGLYTLLGLLSNFKLFFPDHNDPYAFDTDVCYHIEGQILDEEWAVFLKYAARVREIGYHACPTFNEPPFISKKTTSKLYRRTGGAPILPGLRFLAWHRAVEGDHDASTQLFDMLVSPTLSAIAFCHPMFDSRGGGGYNRSRQSIDMTGDDADMKKVLTMCPHLTEVLVGVNFEPETLLRLSAYTRLRVLSLQTSTAADCLEALGQSQHVEELIGSLDPQREDGGSFQRVPSSLGDTLSGGLFPALRRIHMTDHGLVVPYFTSLLPAISSQALAEVTVTGTHFHTLPEDIGPCIQALSSPQFSLSLRKIELYFSFAGIGPLHSPLNFSFHDTFPPLLHAHHLHVLSLSMGRAFLSVSNADLDQMAHAWKDITALRLGNGRRDAFGSSRTFFTPMWTPTVSALVGLADRCTKLVHLQCDIAHSIDVQDARDLTITNLCNTRQWSFERWDWLVKIETDRGRRRRRE